MSNELRDEEVTEIATGLAGIESWQLVDELLKRGWEAKERVRNGRVRTVLLEPADHTRQTTRTSR